MIQRMIRNGIQASTTVPSLTVTGAVSVGTTLAVTGASTLTGAIAAGDLTMGVGKVLMVDAGTGAAGVAPLQFRGSGTNTGIYMSTADQLSFARLGVSQCNWGSGGFTSNVSVTSSASLIASAGLLVNGALRRAIPAAKTSNYVLLNTENIVAAGSGCSTITTPASPVAGQSYTLVNVSGGAVTLTANTGQAIKGVGSTTGTVSLADGTSTEIHLASDAVTWYTGEIPPG